MKNFYTSEEAKQLTKDGFQFPLLFTDNKGNIETIYEIIAMPGMHSNNEVNPSELSVIKHTKNNEPVYLTYKLVDTNKYCKTQVKKCPYYKY